MITYSPSGLGYTLDAAGIACHNTSPFKLAYFHIEFRGTNIESCAGLTADRNLSERYPSFLRQWEVLRYMQPQGPLVYDGIKAKGRLPPAGLSIRNLSTALHQLCIEEKCDESHIPLKLSEAFCRTLDEAGGEATLDAQGRLIYRGFLQLQGDHKIQFFMATPVIGGSCRIWRRYPTMRLIRVSIDENTARTYQTPSKPNERQATLNWLKRPTCINGRSLSPNVASRLTMSPGLLYRAFYEKDFTLAMWAEEALPWPHLDLEPKLLCDLYEELLPLNKGRNEAMSLAKISPRIALWFSKTVPVPGPFDIIWVPDRTSHTLWISRKLMQDVSAALGISRVPSEHSTRPGNKTLLTTSRLHFWAC